MIRTYLEFRPHSGQAQALLDLFKQMNILELAVAQPGCLSTEFTISDDEESVIVTAVWDSPEAYQRWLDRPDRADMAAKLNQVLSEEISVATRSGVYHVAHRVAESEEKD